MGTYYNIRAGLLIGSFPLFYVVSVLFSFIQVIHSFINFDYFLSV